MGFVPHTNLQPAMDGRTLLLTLFLGYVYCLKEVESVVQDGEKQLSNIKKLKDKLFKDYDKMIRPAAHHSNETKVNFDLAPLYIIDLDEEQSLFTFDSWFIMHWKDDRLSWSESEFDGLNNFQVGDHMVWQPDITVYNAHSSNVDPKERSSVNIYSSGEIWWVPPAKVSAYCGVTLDSTYPRDTHTCEVEVGSWSQDGWQMNLTIYYDKMYLDEFQNTNPRWELVDCSLSRDVHKYDCCEEPYISITASFTLKRRYPAHLTVIWIPCILVMILTLAMFWVPSDSGKKFILGGFLLVMLTVLIVYEAAMTKSPQAPSLAVSFVQSTLIAVSSAVFLEVIVLNLSRFSGPQRPPEVLVGVLSRSIGKYIGVFATWCDSIPGDKIQLKEDVEQTDHQHTIRDEWMLMASALDRFLFVVYAVVFAAIHQA